MLLRLLLACLFAFSTTDVFAQQPSVSPAPEVPPGQVDDPAAQVEKAPTDNQKIVFDVMWLPGVKRR